MELNVIIADKYADPYILNKSISSCTLRITDFSEKQNVKMNIY